MGISWNFLTHKSGNENVSIPGNENQILFQGRLQLKEKETFTLSSLKLLWHRHLVVISWNSWAHKTGAENVSIPNDENQVLFHDKILVKESESFALSSYMLLWKSHLVCFVCLYQFSFYIKLLGWVKGFAIFWWLIFFIFQTATKKA